MSSVLIYRPLGDHPPRTKMGELELGRVHSIGDTSVTRDGKRVTVTGEERAALYFGKGFVVMPSEAKGANAAALASMYEIAKRATDEAAAGPATQEPPAAPTDTPPPITTDTPPTTDEPPPVVTERRKARE